MIAPDDVDDVVDLAQKIAKMFDERSIDFLVGSASMIFLLISNAMERDLDKSSFIKGIENVWDRLKEEQDERKN